MKAVVPIAMASLFLITISRTFGATDSEAFSLDLEGPKTIVETPIRLPQALQDVPASVSIIEAREIEALGLKTIPEALRLVPGMVVQQGDANDFKVTYHSGENDFPRRMQVLIDGVSVYRNGLAEVDWVMLPVVMKDIQRIEVTRSPSGAAYGSNALSGAVNIISKRPADHSNTSMAEISRGSDGSSYGLVRYIVDSNRASFRFSADRTLQSGYADRVAAFNIDPTAPISDVVAMIDSNKAHDDYEINRITSASSITLDNSNKIGLDFAVVDGEMQKRDTGQLFQRSYPDKSQRDIMLSAELNSIISKNYFSKLKYSIYQGDIKQRWNACYYGAWLTPELHNLYLISPEHAQRMALSGILTFENISIEDTLGTFLLARKISSMGPDAYNLFCGELNNDYIDTKQTLEWSNTIKAGEQLRIVAGAGISDNRFQSETYVNGTVTQTREWFYSTAEWMPSYRFTNTFGIMTERDSITGNIDTMPRVGTAWHFNDNTTLKAVVATGRRTPDIIETSMDWLLRVRNLTPKLEGKDSANYYWNFRTEDMPSSERIISKEIILMGTINNNVSYDVKAFREDLNDLISRPIGDATTLTNDGELKNTGAEIQLAINPLKDLTLRTAYSYTDVESNNLYELASAARHNGSVSAIYFPDDWIFGVAWYSTNYLNTSPFHRFDLLFGQNFKMDNASTYFWNVTIKYYPNETVPYVKNERILFENSFSKSSIANLALGVSF